jgi:ketosteroid isomerase-like protein
VSRLETVAPYYDAWQTKRGDFSGVPLADDFEFTRAGRDFDSADGYRAMAREAGAAVTSFRVRRQFVDGDAQAYGLMVLTLAGDRITAITGYPDTSVFRSFGLPRTLPD